MQNLFIVGFSILFIVYTFFRWLQLTKFCVNGTCKKCGAVFSWVQATDTVRKTSNSVDVRVGSRTEYIGTVENYAGKMDVYGNVPKVKARGVSTTTSSYGCKCAFCGNFRHFYVANTHIGPWKKF